MFASTKVIFTQKAYKLIILDEADAMTQDAQNALRRSIVYINNLTYLFPLFLLVIEKYTQNVRFCFICNYLNKMIPAIQSRCTKFRFAPLKSDQIQARLEYIIKNEGVNATNDGKQALMDLSEGDMRKVLNVLQSVSSAFPIVNEENVYKCCGIPIKSDINLILKWLLTGKFSAIYASNLLIIVVNCVSEFFSI